MSMQATLIAMLSVCHEVHCQLFQSCAICGIGRTQVTSDTEQSNKMIAGEGMDPGAAINLIRQARPSAQPNTGFMRQLYAFSHKGIDVLQYKEAQDDVPATIA